MYEEGSSQYKYHLQRYGHPSKVGFKDVIHQWKADQWDPVYLLSLYKKAGARYFFALANHHDNLDLWDSRYHSWNALKVGPKKDIIGGWAHAARQAGLPFGVSVHAAHAWTWYEVAQRADKKGPLAGVPYDGKLTMNDGKGTWWEGMAPRLLYAQDHPLSADSHDSSSIHRQWHWGNGAAPPSDAYCQNFLRRTIELIDKYQPELLYFDDTVLPFHPLNDIGLRIVAHHYNQSIQRNNGALKAVVNGKILDEMQRKCLVWDIERGQSNEIEPHPWQTDTCIGSWHYDKRIYEGRRYKSARTVIQTLVDVVSKNGNLLLSIPVKGNGTIDEQEIAVLDEIGRWMNVNQEGIFGTRPWKIFGEGPAISGAAPLSAQGFNEGKGKPLGAEDVRFTVKGNVLYATLFGWPDNGVACIRSLADGSMYRPESIRSVELLGGGATAFRRDTKGLHITLPENRPLHTYAMTVRIR
ncbi:alpha-L-fucosidase [Chitinophaga cymbidii]|uniref:alpha-L-fucosidase n=2 Tax=Chitinophaga cymbidii TaxID=1096750 RepID=A0A512RT63_9BACT|nr:alpha-L-fucosidase [Chitinophaga cymbidii]